MNNKSSRDTLKVATEKRILNEFENKGVNEERMDKVVEAKKGRVGSSHSAMQFDCECDNADCQEIISISTEEYQRVHRESNYFVVIPSHIHLDIEKIIASFSNYVLVEKLIIRPSIL